MVEKQSLGILLRSSKILQLDLQVLPLLWPGLFLSELWIFLDLVSENFFHSVFQLMFFFSLLFFFFGYALIGKGKSRSVDIT